MGYARNYLRLHARILSRRLCCSLVRPLPRHPPGTDNPLSQLVLYHIPNWSSL